MIPIVGVDVAFFLQIVLFAVLTIYILILLKDIHFKISATGMLIILIIVYIIYLIIEFCSPSFRFLTNIKTKDEIKNLLVTLIKTPPTIKSSVDCYSDAPRKKDAELIATESINFTYYSSRDVSGYIDLDIPEEILKKIPYISLEIEHEINLEDELSALDLALFRRNFYDKLIYRYKDYNEQRFMLPNIESYYLMRVGDKTPCSVNCFLFVIFTIIPVVEFYKCYIHCHFYHKNIVIRKLISTKKVMNQEEYQVFNPYLNIFGQKNDFENNDIIHINYEYQIKNHTEYEIAFDEKYKNKIPKYEIERYIDINEQKKIAVVKDNEYYRTSDNGTYFGFLNDDIENFNPENSLANNKVDYPINSKDNLDTENINIYANINTDNNEQGKDNCIITTKNSQK